MAVLCLLAFPVAWVIWFAQTGERSARASSTPTVHTAWPAHYPLPDTVTHPAAGWTCWHGSETYAVVPDQGPQVWVECRGPNNELIAGPGAYRIVKREAGRERE